ncbi:hypothetical protein LCGC14_2604030, partial [marine sediment metagenome]
LLEVDYSGLEVRIAACYHQDPNMLKYINNPASDMHGDMAKQIFKLPKLDKAITEHKVLRDAAKNGFVFPEFYGDYYKNCAESMACNWGELPQSRWKEGQGIKMPEGYLSDHLIAKGIKSYKQCELKLEFINNWKHGRIYFKTEVVAEREINLFSDEPDVLLSNLFSYPSSIDKNLESLYYFKINDCLQFMILELIHDKCLSDPKAYNKADIYNWIYDHMIFPKISGIKDPKDLPGDY